MRPPPRPRRRPGFTMIELLVVMVIIAVLVAMLLPVVNGALRNARNTAVTSDIQLLTQALANFKEKYGDYPPSRIMLSENGRYAVDATATPAAGNRVASANPTATGTDVTYAALAQRSLYYLRKFFPRVAFSTAGPTPGITATNFYDFNGDGVFQDDASAADGFHGVILEGDECLAFFLGGIPMNTSGSPGAPEWSMTGWGKLPTNPFSNNLDDPAKEMYSGNRYPPLFEFKNDRLRDLDGDGMPSYLDSLGTGRPLAYFSAYGGEAYDPNDCNVVEPDDAVTPPVAAITRRFRVSAPVVDQAKAASRLAVSAAPNPYTTSDPNGTTTTAWHKGQTYQIVSAGRDGLFGPGGRYVAEAAEHVPVGTAADLNTTNPIIRLREADNLANFAGATLE